MLCREAKERNVPSKSRARPVLPVCLTVKPVGEPDAGNPHVRFDERGWETGRWHKAPSYRAYPRLYLFHLRTHTAATVAIGGTAEEICSG
jgi:hypothetical protein